MKKTLLFLLASIALTNCGKVKEDLKILCPSGAPAIAFYNYSTNSNFETNSVPKNIVSMMNKTSDKDIVVIDTVSGLKAIGNGAPYKLASTITFGNFFIVSTGNDSNGIMEPGDKIVLFGEKSTPDLVFHYIYGDIYDEGIEYVNAANDAASCLARGINLATSSKIDYVLMAQPSVLATLTNASANTHGKSQIYKNIQKEFKEKSNSHEIIQASIFIKDTTDKTKVNEFLYSLENDIIDGTTNPDLIKQGMDKLDQMEAQTLYGLSSNIAKAVTLDGNQMGLGYKQAYTNKENIDFFISLFGMEVTREEVFYK